MFSAVLIPDFSLEALFRAEPLLRLQAVAVLEGEPPLERVLVASEAARHQGVEAGLTRAQAEAAHKIVLRRRSSEQESAAQAALLDGACSISPRVEAAAAGLVLLDLNGLERLFGPVTQIARELARKISALGMEARIAVSASLDAAILAARGFTGITVIPAGEEAARLGPLSVDVLEAPVEIAQALDRWGVRTLRQFAALPPIPVVERLGQEGLRLQRLARGEDHRKLVPTDAPMHFEESLELEYAVELLEPLSFLLNRMLEALFARLQARALALLELRMLLVLEQLETDIASDSPQRHGGTESKDLASSVSPRLRGEKKFSRTFRLPVPTQDSKTLLKLIQLDLQAHPPQAPVKKIWLEAEPARPRNAQGGLFLPAAPPPERLELLLARMSGVVGEGNLGAPEILDTHRPDGFRLRKFQVSSFEHREKQEAGRRRSDAGVLPASCPLPPAS